jgi:hypothetical protein
MGKIIDGTYLDEESEENKIKIIPEYWDIEDRLYEQYKESKIEEVLDDSQGD